MTNLRGAAAVLAAAVSWLSAIDANAAQFGVQFTGTVNGGQDSYKATFVFDPTRGTFNPDGYGYAPTLFGGDQMSAASLSPLVRATLSIGSSAYSLPTNYGASFTSQINFNPDTGSQPSIQASTLTTPVTTVIVNGDIYAQAQSVSLGVRADPSAFIPIGLNSTGPGIFPTAGGGSNSGFYSLPTTAGTLSGIFDTGSSVRVYGLPQINVAVEAVNGNQIVPNGPTIRAIFSPTEDGHAITIQQAAEDLGYTGFNWYQEVVADPNPPQRAGALGQTPLTAPYIDPPLGGYQYQVDKGYPLPTNYPFIYNLDQLPSHESPDHTGIYFSDTPNSPFLNPGEYVAFVTSLIGLLPGSRPLTPMFDPLNTFQWQSNHSCNTDDECGVGGVTVLREGEDFEVPLGYGGVDVLATNVDINSLPSDVRRLMIESGAQGIGSSVPEPETWSMLIFGFFACGIAFRSNYRRKTYS